MQLHSELQHVYRFGVFELDPRAAELRKNGVKLKIQEQPYQVLLKLLEHAGEIVSREDLRSSIWAADTFVDFETGLNTVIKRLRETLGDSAETPMFIETVPRRGYRFIGPVDAQPRMPLAEISQSQRVKPNEVPLHFLWYALAGLAVITAAIVLFRQTLVPERPIVSSIAVLPFTSPTDPTLDDLGDRITEGIIDGLSQIPNLKVMSRSAVFRYKGLNADPQKVGRELKVTAVLTGRITRRGGTTSISSELVDVADDSQFWGRQYSDDVGEDTANLQQTIVTDLADKMRFRLNPEEKRRLTKRQTQDLEAYRLYLRGRRSADEWEGEGWRKAIRYFQQAIDKDPGYAAAYAGMADAYAYLGFLEFMPPRPALETAKTAAMKAVELDGTLAEAHAALGLTRLFNWEWDGAEQEFRRAIELNPNLGLAHQYYYLDLAANGRFKEAEAQIKLAQELDPLSLHIASDFADLYYWMRKYDRAIECSQKVLEIDPNYSHAVNQLALIDETKGTFDKATLAWERFLSLEGRAESSRAVAIAYKTSGYDGVLKVMIDLQKDPSDTELYIPEIVAGQYALLGDRENAIRWLQRGYDERALLFTKVEPHLDTIRTDPRFTDLLHRMGLSQ